MTRFLIAGLTLMIAGCSGTSDTTQDPAPVALVKLAPVTPGGSVQLITVYGSADPGAMGKMTLVAPSEARVVAIDAPIGSQVKQGQVIVRLAPSPTTRADAAKALSDATAANAALARAQRLRADGLVGDADVETARAAAAAANAMQASFASRTGGLILRAPAAGTVDMVPVAIGDLLQPGAAVASVTRRSDIRARFGIDPETARLVRPGMTMQLTGRTGRTSLIIESVSPIVDPQTRLASVFARIPASSGLAAGEPMTATIDLGNGGPGVSIPYAAILDDAGQPYVYVVQGNVAHRRDLVIQPSSGERVTVTKGLRSGEQVILEGGTAVEDGMKVRTK